MHELLISTRFEVRYHLRQPVFYGLFALMIAQGVATGLTTFAQFADVRLFSNAPTLFYVAFAGLGPLLTATVALLTGQTLLRDRDYSVGTYLYALPIESRLYFSGQFLGTLAVGTLLAVGYVLGLLTVPFWTNAPTGTFPVVALLDGFAQLLLTNLLVIVCLSFALTALLRHMAGAYVTMLVLTLGSTLLQLGYTSVVSIDALHLLDPFGMLTVRQKIDELTVVEKNGYVLSAGMPDLLFINRLLWLGLAGWLLTRADQRLSFPYWLDQAPAIRFKLDWLLRRKAGGTAVVQEPGQSLSIPTVSRRFSSWVRWRMAARLAWTDTRWLVRQPAVAIGLGLLVMGIVAYANGLGSPDADLTTSGQRLLPFTSRLTFVRLPMHLYISLFLVVFTGELVHRERTSRLWLLTDATPQPSWVLLLGKVGAMMLLAAALTATLFLTGLTIQHLNGQTPIDWSLYARDLLGDGLFRYTQVIAMAALVQAMLPNRFVGHLVVLLLVGSLTYLDQQTGGLATYLYTHLPASWQYSELIGYGTATAVRPALMVLWGVVAAGLLWLAVRLAQRGEFVRLGTLVARFKGGLSRSYLAIGSTLLVAGAGSVVWLQRVGHNPAPAEQITPYNTTTQQIRVGDQAVNVQYHYVHAQNREAIQTAVVRALQQGQRWLGDPNQNVFTNATLHITETPYSVPQTTTKAGQIQLSERDGWMTDRSRPFDAGLLDMAVTKQVLDQWFAVGLARHQKPNGLLLDGLSTYLATRIVHQTRGDDWLTQQLAHFEITYRRGRAQDIDREPTAAEATAGTYVAEAKTPISLTAIGEVWGHDSLCQQIGRFYQTYRAKPVEPDRYVADLQNALPAEYRYLTTYLTERPQLFFALGAIGHYDDRLGIQLFAEKYTDDGFGTLRQNLPNDYDYVPVALLDEQGRVIHRQLVLVYPTVTDDKPVWLPRPKNAATVVIDPLGAFAEANKTNNRKALMRL